MIRFRSVEVVLLFVTMIATSCKSGYFTPQQTIEIREEWTAEPSFSSPSPLTVDLTNTPQPAQSLMPTISITPGVLDCEAIIKAHMEAASGEWEGAKLLLRGSEFYYTGRVTSVTETDAVHMSGSLCHITLHDVPHEVAVTLSKGQLIEGYGIIDSIGYYLGEDVDVEVNPDLLFVR